MGFDEQRATELFLVFIRVFVCRVVGVIGLHVLFRSLGLGCLGGLLGFWVDFGLWAGAVCCSSQFRR